jgi:ribosomal protein S8E
MSSREDHLPHILSKRWDVLIPPKVKAMSEATLVTKPCFVGERFTKVHVTHPELKAIFQLPIISVKKNQLSSPLYTSLGVITNEPE